MNKEQIRQAIADKYGKQANFCDEIGIKTNVLTQHLDGIINSENKLVSFYDKLSMQVVISDKSQSIFADYVKRVIAKKPHFLRSEMLALGFCGLVTETREFEQMEFDRMAAELEASDVLISLAYICAGMGFTDIAVTNPENPEILEIAISLLEDYKKSFYNQIDRLGIRMLLSAYMSNFLMACKKHDIALSDMIRTSIEKHNL